MTCTVPNDGRDFVGYGRETPQVRWPGDARVAVSVIVNYECGAEVTFERDGYNDVMGEYLYPTEGVDLQLQSVYEYGARAGFWRLARLFDEYGVRVTFVTSGEAVVRNPQTAAYLRESEHEVAGHGYRYAAPARLSRDEERDEIQATIEALERCCGERPVGWLSPKGASVNTRELLVEEGGFLYDSDGLADDLPYYTQVDGRRHLVIPLSYTYNDTRFIAGSADDPAAFLTYLRWGFDELWHEGATHPKVMTIGTHPRILGQAARAHALRRFFEHARGKGGVWFATRREIAEWWAAHHKEATP